MQMGLSQSSLYKREMLALTCLLIIPLLMLSCKGNVALSNYFNLIKAILLFKINQGMVSSP